MAFQINTSPLVQSGANIGNALAGLGQAYGARQQQNRQQQQEQAQQQKMQELYSGAAQGNIDSINELWGQSPQMAQLFEQREAEKVAKLGAAQALESKKAETDWGLRWKQASPEQKQGLLDEAMANPLIDIDDDDVGFEGEQQDFAVNNMLFGHLGKDGYKAVLGESKEQPKLSAEAVAFNDLIKDFTPQQQKTAKLVKAGLKGRAVSNAELSAIESGDIKSYSDYKVQQKQAEKFAEMTGASRSKAIDKGFDSITKISAGIRNIDNAIGALDKGAGVGAVEKLWPSIKASSVELDNIRGQMALDVVGATTFGALSKGELDLAKDIALPTGLDTPELKDYLTRKRAAQEKLKSYYNEQIQFLDQGGTVAGFLRQKEKESTGQPAQDVNKQALDWANANPNDPRAAQILQKIGG